MLALLIIFLTYTFLAVFSAGAMLTLPVQHFALYPLVGREAFCAVHSTTGATRRDLERVADSILRNWPPPESSQPPREADSHQDDS
jgi:hypothetical protein